MKTVLLIDNFDSFTFNLYQYLSELTDSVTVVRNTNIPINDIELGKFSHIVISPGPGDPTDASYFGDTMQVIQKYYKTYPILGICLGHQGIGVAFGGSIVSAPQIMHGKVSSFSHNGKGILYNIPDQITVMRYHSLVIDPSTIPDDLIIDARADDGAIMAIHHNQYPVFGLQFHPESFRTDYGKQLLSNFLEVAPRA